MDVGSTEHNKIDISFNPNLQPFEFELTSKNEEALIKLGEWWEGKIIAEGKDFTDLDCVKTLSPDVTYRGLYTLVTHHTNSDKSKQSIFDLGGVIYLPDTQQTLFYGGDAGKQLRSILSVKGTGQTPYGEIKDGKTFVYLHPIPPDLYEDAEVYLAGPKGMSLARAFSDDPPDFNGSKYNLEQALQAPWVALDAWLTEQNGKVIKEHLPQYTEELDQNPKLVYKMRMVENRYLIAVV